VRNVAGEEIEAITFLVKSTEKRTGLWTSLDYVQHIVEGLRSHEVPEEYVQRVINIAIEANKLVAHTAADHIRMIEGLRGKST
jgi:hypothetical protein